MEIPRSEIGGPWSFFPVCPLGRVWTQGSSLSSMSLTNEECMTGIHYNGREGKSRNNQATRMTLRSGGPPRQQGRTHFCGVVARRIGGSKCRSHRVIPSTPPHPTSIGMLNRLTRISLLTVVLTGGQWRTEGGLGWVLKIVSSVFVLCHGYSCVMVDNSFMVSLPNRSGLF